MTYDLYFLSPDQASDPAAFMQRLEAPKPASTPEGVRRKTAVVEALMRLDPSLEIFVPDFNEVARAQGISVEEARSATALVQLVPPEDRDNGLLINVQEAFVDFNICYGQGAREADRIFSTIERYAGAIVTIGNYRIYDPQLERVVDSFATIRSDGLREYWRVGEHMKGVIASLQSQQKPWWKVW